MYELSDTALNELKVQIEENISPNGMDCSIGSVVMIYLYSALVHAAANFIGSVIVNEIDPENTVSVPAQMAAAAVGSAVLFPLLHSIGASACTSSRERDYNPAPDHTCATVLWHIRLLSKLSGRTNTASSIIWASGLMVCSSLLYSLTGGAILYKITPPTRISDKIAAAILGAITFRVALGLLFIMYHLANSKVSCVAPEDYYRNTASAAAGSPRVQVMEREMVVIPDIQNKVVNISVDFEQLIRNRDSADLDNNARNVVPYPLLFSKINGTDALINPVSHKLATPPYPG